MLYAFGCAFTTHERKYELRNKLEDVNSFYLGLFSSSLGQLPKCYDPQRPFSASWALIMVFAPRELEARETLPFSGSEKGLWSGLGPVNDFI